MTWIAVFSLIFFFFSSRRRHTRCLSDWSSDVCSSDLGCAIVRYFDGGLNLRELDQAASALAHALQARGFAAGDRLALYTQNNPAFVIGLVAAWKLGGIAVQIGRASGRERG